MFIKLSAGLESKAQSELILIFKIRSLHSLSSVCEHEEQMGEKPLISQSKYISITSALKKILPNIIP